MTRKTPEKKHREPRKTVVQTLEKSGMENKNKKTHARYSVAALVISHRRRFIIRFYKATYSPGARDGAGFNTLVHDVNTNCNLSSAPSWHFTRWFGAQTVISFQLGQTILSAAPSLNLLNHLLHASLSRLLELLVQEN